MPRKKKQSVPSQETVSCDAVCVCGALWANPRMFQATDNPSTEPFPLGWLMLQTATSRDGLLLAQHCPRCEPDKWTMALKTVRAENSLPVAITDLAAVDLAACIQDQAPGAEVHINFSLNNPNRFRFTPPPRAHPQP